jgi:hypothetical protein
MQVGFGRRPRLGLQDVRPAPASRSQLHMAHELGAVSTRRIPGRRSLSPATRIGSRRGCYRCRS